MPQKLTLAKQYTDAELRASILRGGVTALKASYPGVTVDNILTDLIYRAFFLVMVNETASNESLPPQVAKVVNALKKEAEELEAAERAKEKKAKKASKK